MTDTKKPRHSDLTSRYLAAIVDSSDDAIVSKDLNGIITSWNAGAERIFGYSAQEMIGASILTIIPAERRDEETYILSNLRSGRRIDHYETIRVAKDGRHLHVSLTVSPIKDDEGNVVGVSKIARDITEKKRIEEELRKAKEAAEIARAEAEKASRMKDEFLSTLSHELRTPLNAVIGWANLLLSGGIEPDELEHGLEVIQRNANAQAKIINDLLDMSRIILGKVQLEVRSVDIAAVISESMESVRVAAQAKGVDLRSVVNPSIGIVSGDASRLQQVFWNLLSNAIKFTPRHGRVHVSGDIIDSRVEIRIEDSGEGIPSDFIPFLFDRFQQVDASTTRRHGGLGLGLAIVKQLIELHGGRVSAQSEGLGKGSTFIVSLPLRAVKWQDEPKSADSRDEPESFSFPPISLEGVSIAVVDDDADARELLKRILMIAHAAVSAFSSAGAFLEALPTSQIDVLICDIGMPEEDGYTLIQKLRASESGQKRALPAIALTAYARSEDRIRAIRSGFQSHLAKPVDPAELLAVIQSLTQ